MTVTIVNNSNKMSLYKWDSDRYLQLSGTDVDKAIFVTFYTNVFDSMEVYVSDDYTVAIPNQLLSGECSGDIHFTVNNYTETLYKGNFTVLEKDKPQDYELEITDLRNAYNFEIISTPTDGNVEDESTLMGRANIEKFDFSDWELSENATNSGFASMFLNCINLAEVNFKGNKSLNAKNTQLMFSNCEKLTDIDLSNFITTDLTTVDHMFNGCSALKNLNLSGWDFSNATALVSSWTTPYEGTFSGCTSLQSVNLSNCIIPDSTLLEKLFAGSMSDTLVNDCYSSLKSIDLSYATFNGNSLRFVDYTPVTDESGNYRYIDFKTINLTGLHAPNLTSMACMFFYNRDTTTLDLTSIDTSKVINMQAVFCGCMSLTSLDIKHFNTSKVTTMQDMFCGCWNLASLDLGGWDVSSVTNMSGIFNNCGSLKTLSLQGWDFSNISFNGIGAFAKCTALESLDLSGTTFTDEEVTVTIVEDSGTTTKTERVSLLTDVIENCTALKELNLSGATFNGASFPKFTCIVDSKTYSPLEKIDFSNMSAPNVKHINGLFRYCYNVVSIDISNFSIPEGINANALFLGDKNLISINFEGFDTSNITQMTQWFYGCSSIETLDLSTIDTTNSRDFSWFCTGCSSLKNITLSNNWASNTSSCSVGEYDPLDFSDSPLTHDSCLDIFNKLATRTDTSYEHRVYISPTTYSYMSSSEFKIAIDKGWSIYYKTDSGSMLKGTYQQITI